MSDFSYRLSRNLAWMLAAPFVRLQIWNPPASLRPAGAAVFVSNHISHFDPVFLAFAFSQPIDWMTTTEFFDHRLIGPWLRKLNTFPVDRSRPDRKALRLALERLRAGRLVGVFPEGGIRAGPTSILGGVTPKGGAVALARLASVPLVPGIIFGSDRLYGARNWIPFPGRVPVWIAIGSAFEVKDADDEAANQRLVTALRELAGATIAHFALASDDLPATPEHRKRRDARA